MKTICNFDDCTGCSACASVCPKQCITMRADEEGFLRPCIEQDSCVDCGKCVRTCPINNQYCDDGVKPDAYAAINIDYDVRVASSSGGLFSVLANYILEHNGIVIGAIFDDSFNVVHSVCTDKDDLNAVRGSKYVQSNINGTYQVAKENLDKGKLVLFTGTACQIGGLKAYLGKEYEKLYTQDVICHGVPSPLVWNKYMEYQSQGAVKDIESISFRAKIPSWKVYSLRFLYKNCSEYTEPLTKNMYMHCFLRDLCLRPSCYNCHFKQVHRQADFTLADFWGIDQLKMEIPEFNDDKGVSLLLVHSAKGKALLNAVSGCVKIVKVNYDEGVKYNPSMTRSVRKPFFRKYFMKNIMQMPFDKVHDKYSGTDILSRVVRRLARVLE